MRDIFSEREVFGDEPGDDDDVLATLAAGAAPAPEFDLGALDSLASVSAEAPRGEAAADEHAAPLAALAAPAALPRDAGRDTLDANARPFSVPDQRDDLLASRDRARELYQAQPQPTPQSGPGAEEARYSEINYRPSRQDMQRAWILQSLFGNDGDNFRVVEMLQRQAGDYDAGLEAARAKDRASTPKRADLATVEQAALSGLSPEAAASLSENSRAIDLMRSGALNLGTRLRGQDTQLLTADTREVGDTYRQGVSEAGKDRRAQLAADTAVQTAQIRKRDARTGGGAGAGVDSPDVLAAYLTQQANVPLDTARSYADGTLDPSGVDRDTLERLEVAATLFRSVPAKDRVQMIKGREGAEGGNADAATRAAEVKRADPAYRLKLKQETNAIGVPLRDAIVSYNRLSPQARQIVAKVGLSGSLSQLREARLTPQEQADVGAVISQINNAVKAMSGAAVSTSEWQRLGASMGVTGEGFSPFKSSAGLGAWLQRAKREFDANRASVDQEFPGLYGGGK